MISEKRLAVGFSSFWADVMPMGERFLRRLNMQTERFCVPLRSTTSRHARGLINELSFRMFCECRRRAVPPADLSSDIIDELERDTIDFIVRFRETDQSVIASDSDARAEALQLSSRTSDFFAARHADDNLLCSPIFYGCGKLDSCQGDVLAGRTLYEVKAGDRAFRLVDLRQLLCYCALNYGSRQHTIENVGLLNPRVGIEATYPLDVVCHEAAGVDPKELFADILDLVSHNEASR